MKNITLTCLSLLLALTLAYLTQWLPSTLLVLSYTFVGLFSLLMFLMQRLASNTSSESSFVRNFMGTIIVKLFSALIFLTVVLYTHKSSWATQEKIIFSLVVFSTYVVFTVVMGRAQSKK